MKSIQYKLIFIIIASLFPLITFANHETFLGQPSAINREAKLHGHTEDTRLTGNWGGLRDSMEAKGIILEAVYTGEIVHNFDPGLIKQKKETLYLDNIDLTLTIDTEKADLWDGGTFFFYGLNNSGDNPTEDVIGDIQTVSNIEAPSKFLLYEAWYEQDLSDTFSVLVGLHDLNSEFYVSEYSSLFLNSSPGIGPEISANVTPSIFPKTALGVRIHYDPTDYWYIQTAIYDGDPDTRGFKSKEGEMYILESVLNSSTGSYKIGYWQHSADLIFNNKNFSYNYGYYAIIDQKLMDLDNDGVIGGFLRWGNVPDKRNEVTSHIDLGLHIHGLIPKRHNDDLGIAYIQADTRTGNEKVIELTYRIAVSPWMAIQPSLQRIRNPGGDRHNASINVALFRFEISI